MSPGLLVPIILIAWCALCVIVAGIVAPRLGRICGNDPITGLFCLIVSWYLRLIHHPRYRGLNHVPTPTIRDGKIPGGMIIVANHTAGIDPLLIQAACRFQIRWMMSREMMVPALDWLWRRQRIIPVDFDSGDSVALKEAIRHVKSGGVLGIFPEGGIEDPACVLRPFLPGAGLIVARCRVPVLLAWIHGTPQAKTAFHALVRSSRSKVDFLGVLNYDRSSDAREIVEDLRQRIADASGWPKSDRLVERHPRAASLMDSTVSD